MCGEMVHIEQVYCDAEKERVTRLILESLTDWFGISEAREAYVAESAGKPFFCAYHRDITVGFVYLKETGLHTVELAAMGVRKEYHKKGIGRKLFDAAKREAEQQGYSFIQVKTVQMGKYAQYDDTNRFYLSLGFKELEVFPTLWDEWNPCQIYIMALHNRAPFRDLAQIKPKIGSDKSMRYRSLVERARLDYSTYDEPNDGKKPRLSWCDDCNEINLWTYWQGRGNLDAKILLVGQDWGCIQDESGRHCISKVQIANRNGQYNYLEGNCSETDWNLVMLFKEALGLDIVKSCSDVFFTNFVLGYRDAGTSGGFKKDWIQHDKNYFRELVEIIQPNVILCLGRHTFEGVMASFGKNSEVKIKAYNSFIESESNPVLVECSSGKNVHVFALAHCGAMGTLNRNEKKTKSLTLQIEDWKKIKPYLGL